MPTRLICPRCQAVLSVRDDAPARITCLRCLAVVRNPSDARSEIARPAIPVEEETARDVGGTILLLGGLGVLMGVGTLASFLMGNFALGCLMLLGTGGLAVAILLFWADARAKTANTLRSSRYEDFMSEQTRTLGYRVPVPVVAGAAVVRGCLLALLVVGGVVLLLFGLCIAVVVGDSMLSGPWPPR